MPYWLFVNAFGLLALVSEILEVASDFAMCGDLPLPLRVQVRLSDQRACRWPTLSDGEGILPEGHLFERYAVFSDNLAFFRLRFLDQLGNCLLKSAPVVTMFGALVPHQPLAYAVHHFLLAYGCGVGQHTA